MVVEAGGDVTVSVTGGKVVVTGVPFTVVIIVTGGLVTVVTIVTGGLVTVVVIFVTGGLVGGFVVVGGVVVVVVVVGIRMKFATTVLSLLITTLVVAKLGFTTPPVQF